MESSSIITQDNGLSIAYNAIAGKSPGIMFLHGFRSDMTGTKAVAIADYCRKQGRAFTALDYRGHGASGGEFRKSTIGDWLSDATLVFDKITQGPQILVGSSMGGWLMLLLALKRPERIRGLLGLAPAPDFTQDLIWEVLSSAEREKLLQEGEITLGTPYDPDPYLITRALVEEGRQHLLLKNGQLPINCPVRLIHGMEDKDVPWQTSVKIAEKLASPNVRLNLLKSSGHRLSEPPEIEIIIRELEGGEWF